MKVTKAKAIAATIGAFVTVGGAVVAALSDGNLSGAEVGTLVTVAITAFGTVAAVYKTENKPVGS